MGARSDSIASEAASSPPVLWRRGSNDLYVLESGGRKLLAKTYPGPDGLQRRDCEREMLGYWNGRGIRTPHVYAIPLRGISDPYLVFEFLAGQSLRDYLAGGTPRAEKLRMVGSVYADVRRRHLLAIANQDLRLFHPDPNTGNILIDGESSLSWIDLETTRTDADPLDAAAFEIAKLTRWIVRDLSRESLAEVVRTIGESYSLPDVLRRMCRQTLDRRWQFWHRWRDRRRKRRDPQLVTKYDLVDAIALH